MQVLLNKKHVSLVIFLLLFVGFFPVLTRRVSAAEASSGWDFECHTYSHRDLTELTPDEIALELQRVNTLFQAHGLPLPEHHAYPYGEYNDAVINVVKQYRKSGRTGGSGDGLTTYPVANWYRLNTVCISSRKSFSQIQTLIDTAITRRELLCLFTHKVINNPGEYSCTPAMLTQILDYLLTKQNAGQLSAMTMRQAYTSYTGEKAVVVLSFDDGWKTDYTTVWPMFKARGLVGTSYIIAEAPEMNEPDHMTWAMISEMAQTPPPPPSMGWLVTIASNPSDGGTTTPSGLQNVTSGTLTVEASPAANYTFRYWLFDGNNLTANPLTLPAQANGTTHTLTAFFSQNASQLIFQSGFESGGIVSDGWTGTGNDPGDTRAIISTDRHHGTYCVKSSLSGGAYESAYCYKTITGQNVLYCVGCFKLLTALPPAGTYFAVMRFGGTGAICYVYFERLSGGTLLITLAYRNGANWEYRSYTYAYSLNVWYTIEMYAKIDSAAGAYTVWLNYNQILGVTNKNSANYGSITNVRVGVTSGDTATVHQVESDCIAIDTQYISSDPYGSL